MRNIYDIRKEESLVYILPERVAQGQVSRDVLEETSVAVHLYYIDTVDFYFKYLDNIPEEINVYIISAVPEIWKRVHVYQEKRKNVILLKKENRGRDISALLVTFREFALKYKYICYIHDKKEKHEYLKHDIDMWIKNLWGNTIGSKEYVYNVLRMLEENREMGLLVPPEPMGEYLNTWFQNLWAHNFENVQHFSNELQLECDLNKEKMPITLGTVFWARTQALEKLFQKHWTFEHFPEEPLAVDGTLNHTIERILGYVAQDAGYKTGTVMTDSYAAERLLYQQEKLGELCRHIDTDCNIHSLHQLESMQKQRRVIIDFFKKNQSVYLYGAGVFGIELLDLIRSWGHEPKGFLVSDGHKKIEKLAGLNVYELGEISMDCRTEGIIISVDYALQNEITMILEKLNYNNYILGYV